MKTRSNRLGLVLFGIYLAMYVGFVLINAVNPELMETTPVEGLNLAVLYGFGLIIAAFALALLYGLLAGRSDAVEDTGTDKQEVSA